MFGGKHFIVSYSLLDPIHYRVKSFYYYTLYGRPPTFSTKIELVLHIPYINVSVCYEFTKMLTRNLWNDHHLNDN